MKLTAVIICRSRQEKGLKRALKSVEFADEILVEERRETGDFAAARNEALRKAKGEWVVFVDSDEEIGEELKKEIRQITDKGYKDYEFRTWLSRWRKFARSPSPARPDVRRDSGQAPRYARGGLRRQQSHSQICQLRQFFKCETREDYKNYNIGGAYFKRRDRFLGKWLNHGETASVRLLRLGRKEAGKWERPVHEVWKIGGRIVELKNPIWHYSHESVDEMIGKLDRYSEMEAEYRQTKIVTLLNCYIVKLLTAVQMIIFPLAKFTVNYFFRLGFLEGMEGFIHAILMSGHSFLVRAKILSRYELKYLIL